MRAKELPTVRPEQTKWLNAPTSVEMFRRYAENDMFMGTDFYRGRGDELREREIRRWDLAEMFYVTEDMTAVALTAAPTLPSFRLQREDLPSEFGFIYFDAPIDESMGTAGGRTQVVGCLWGIENGPPDGGVWMSFYANQRFTSAEAVRAGDWTPEEAALVDARTPALGYDDETVWKFNLDDSDQPSLRNSDSAVIAMAKVVRSAWLLMQQPLARTSAPRVGRADMKRARRNQIDPTAVRVISLRRSHNPDAPQTDDHRTYHHRWVVRGHWRNQPCGPGRTERKPTWIPWHVKGPEDAPLLTGAKVQAWRR